MSKRKNTDDTMPGANRDTSDAATVERKKPQPKQVIDPITHEWRDETKEERFVRLGKQRTLNAEKRLRQLIPLGNRKQYPHTDEQAKKILDRLAKALEAVVDAFQERAVSNGDFDL